MPPRGDRLTAPAAAGRRPVLAIATGRRAFDVVTRTKTIAVQRLVPLAVPRGVAPDDVSARADRDVAADAVDTGSAIGN